MSQDKHSLFGSTSSHEPLASRMRPRIISEYIGQDHIMGPGRLLRRAIQADQLSSIIFSGPPGTGKTTLARVIANSTKSDFISLNAVLTGVADIREAIEKAKSQKALHDRRTILFVDEVHRWNKAQQDALLPWVENGTFILIGATTENPYFEVNAALVSRSRVFQLIPLSAENLRAIAGQALQDPLRGYGNWQVNFEETALEHLVHTASGDARSLLNAMELAVETTPATWPPPAGSKIEITLSVAEDSIQQKALLYDKEGDYHFDSISAFIKSIRGSDPDATLYWMARMIKAGESPRFIFRRMMISASEDIGLADPQALVVTQSAAAAFDRVGLPEGQFFLAQAALYLAIAPKSNSTLGYFEALKTLEDQDTGEVPNHLKDASRDKKGFGHGEGYQYPHAFRDHWTAQNYLPAKLRKQVFYTPGELGHEGSLRPLILQRREIQLADAKDDESIETLTFSPADRQLGHFVRRSESGMESWLAEARALVFANLAHARHQRLAIVGSESAYWVPEALRQVPEGMVYSLVAADSVKAQVEELEMAALQGRCQVLDWLSLTGNFTEGLPERLAGFNVLLRSTPDIRSGLLADLYDNSDPAAQMVLLEQIPSAAPRLSSLVDGINMDQGLLERIRSAEEMLYGGQMDATQLAAGLLSAPEGREASCWWKLKELKEAILHRRRLIAPQVLAAWCSTQKPGSYGRVLCDALGKSDWERWQQYISANLSGKTVNWPVTVAIITGNKSG